MLTQDERTSIVEELKQYILTRLPDIVTALVISSKQNQADKQTVAEWLAKNKDVLDKADRIVAEATELAGRGMSLTEMLDEAAKKVRSA